MENESPPFTFRAVQIFVAAVEAQSVTRAAHRLGVSPSSVSQQLTNLEEALGAPLIRRTARTFRLTEAGRLFLDRAKRILDDVGAAKAELSLAGRAPPMRLRVAAIEELDAGLAAAWLSRLRAEMPNIAVALSGGASHENHDALGARAIDLTLAVDMEGDVDWVEHHPILRDPFILVTAKGLPGDLAALEDRPFIRYAREHLIGRRIEAQLRRAGLQPPHSYEFTSNQALFSMVAAQRGWAVTTALSLLCAPAGLGLTPHPLPLPRFSRRLALHARRDALGDLPGVMAAALRAEIAGLASEAEARLPFLAGAFQVLGRD